MPRISGLITLALVGAMAVGPAMAAPQFAGTNDAAGSAGDRTVDCSDAANRYMPFCEAINNQALGTSAQITSGARRTNSLLCPSNDLVAAGTDRHGNRLYRCAASSPAAKANSRAMTFFPGN
jgi:hypothetical protein